MDSQIRKYCRHIIKSQLKVLRYDMQKGKYWDYPAMASICYNKIRTQMKRGYSHSPKGTKWNEILKKKMERLAPIGGRSRKVAYIVGNCAEQHAGNNYMNAYHEKDLKQLFFSKSVRPRTMQEFEPCENCKFIFPNL